MREPRDKHNVTRNRDNVVPLFHSSIWLFFCFLARKSLKVHRSGTINIIQTVSTMYLSSIVVTDFQVVNIGKGAGNGVLIGEGHIWKIFNSTYINFLFSRDIPFKKSSVIHDNFVFFSKQLKFGRFNLQNTNMTEI